MRICPRAGGRGLLKLLQESLDFSFGKCLAVGIKLSQQRWEYLGEMGQNLLELREGATERLDSEQVFAEPLHSFHFIWPDTLPILAGQARWIAPPAIV